MEPPEYYESDDGGEYVHKSALAEMIAAGDAMRDELQVIAADLRDTLPDDECPDLRELLNRWNSAVAKASA